MPAASTQIKAPVETQLSRHQAVTSAEHSVRLEGFELPGQMRVINARFVRGEISADVHLTQARALCEAIARESRTRSA